MKYNYKYGTFTVTVFDRELHDYFVYPEIFIVNIDHYANCT